jgi:transcriptional regulator with XRE-family HTH domain
MIGQEVRRRREELGLTGAQLAARSGLSPGAVSQIENGKRTPSATTVMKLAQGLGVDVGELFPKAQAPLPLDDGGAAQRGVLGEERRSPLRPWATHARRMAARIRSHAADPHSPAYRDAWAALFFLEERNRDAAELWGMLFEEELEREPLADEPLAALDPVLAAFEELAEALAEAQRRAEQMAAGLAESEIGQARRRAAEAAAQREQAAAQFNTRRERRGA